MIANFEGTLNASTLICNITTTEGMRIGTMWSVQDLIFPGAVQSIFDDFAPELFLVSGDQRPNHDLGITHRNKLTMTSQLDGVTIYCGLGQSTLSEQANFQALESVP